MSKLFTVLGLAGTMVATGATAAGITYAVVKKNKEDKAAEIVGTPARQAHLFYHINEIKINTPGNLYMDMKSDYIEKVQNLLGTCAKPNDMYKFKNITFASDPDQDIFKSSPSKIYGKELVANMSKGLKTLRSYLQNDTSKFEYNSKDVIIQKKYIESGEWNKIVKIDSTTGISTAVDQENASTSFVKEILINMTHHFSQLFEQEA